MLIEKDPFGDSDKYIAELVHDGSLLAIRCIQGDLAAVFTRSGQAEVGTPADVKVRIDDGPVLSLKGQVLLRSAAQNLVEFDETALLNDIAKAKQIAIRSVVLDVTETRMFPVREGEKIVAGVRKACRKT